MHDFEKLLSKKEKEEEMIKNNTQNATNNEGQIINDFIKTKLLRLDEIEKIIKRD